MYLLFSESIAHYSHVLGVKGWYQRLVSNDEYKLTIVRSINFMIDTEVVILTIQRVFNTAVHATACNLHIQMARDTGKLIL